MKRKLYSVARLFVAIALVSLVACTPEQTDYFQDPGRGDKVNAMQEIDFDIKVVVKNNTYKVIFAKHNLTQKGLTAKESDLGDFYAWAALDTWYKYYVYSSGDSILSDVAFKDDKPGGYVPANAQYYVLNSDSITGSYALYNNEHRLRVLDIERDDVAQHILGADWQLPTLEMWEKLFSATSGCNCEWVDINGVYGCKVTKKGVPGYMFLPAAGKFVGQRGYEAGKTGNYWTCELNGGDIEMANTFCFYQEETSSDPLLVVMDGKEYRHVGMPIRPVRLVHVEEQ